MRGIIERFGPAMSTSAITSAVSSATLSSVSSTTSSSSSSFDSSDFLTLLVEQLKNQNPLEPTDTAQIMSQMVSYATYDAQTTTNSTLSAIATTLDTISSRLDTLV